MSDQSLSYEKARDELIKIVEKLESGTATLDESLKLWQRGEECNENPTDVRYTIRRAGARRGLGGKYRSESSGSYPDG